jgi:hypothetical protein
MCSDGAHTHLSQIAQSAVCLETCLPLHLIANLGRPALLRATSSGIAYSM